MALDTRGLRSSVRRRPASGDRAQDRARQQGSQTVIELIPAAELPTGFDSSRPSSHPQIPSCQALPGSARRYSRRKVSDDGTSSQVSLAKPPPGSTFDPLLIACRNRGRRGMALEQVGPMREAVCRQGRIHCSSTSIATLQQLLPGRGMIGVRSPTSRRNLPYGVFSVGVGISKVGVAIEQNIPICPPCRSAVV